MTKNPEETHEVRQTGARYAQTLNLLAGTQISKNKILTVALTSVYGLGKSSARRACRQANIDPEQKGHSLTKRQLSDLRQVLRDNPDFIIDGLRRKMVADARKRLVDIRSLRGRRDLRGLPRRGQRTQTNSKTARKVSKFKSRSEGKNK